MFTEHKLFDCSFEGSSGFKADVAVAAGFKADDAVAVLTNCD